VRHVPRSSGLLRVKTSRVRVFSLSSRLAEARRQVVHVAPPRRSYEDQFEDGRVDTTGYVRPYYPYFAIFYVLGTRSILVF
jgi:hypothetical protein